MVHGQILTRQMLTNKVGDWTNAYQKNIIKEINDKIKQILFIYLHSES